MNKNLKENLESYLKYLEDYVRITADLQEHILDAYELRQITKEEVVDFCIKMDKIVRTAKIEEVVDRFDEIFSEELTKRMREEMSVEEG